MRTYKVEFSDGTKLEHVILSGETFFAEGALSLGFPEGIKASVSVSSEWESTEENPAEAWTTAPALVKLAGGESSTRAFSVSEVSPAKLAELKGKSDIAYLAMMTGIEL